MGEVVGRGATGTTTTATTTSTVPGQSVLIKNINDRLNVSGLGTITSTVNVTVDDAIAALTSAQKKQIGAILDKAGFTVRTPAEVDAVLATYFPGLTWKDYPDLLRQVKDNLITKPTDTGGPKTSISITQYGPEQIDEWINAGVQKKFGRTIESLTDQELSTLRKAVKDYSMKGAVTTTTKDKKGRSVTTTTPGPSTAGIQGVVAETGAPMFLGEEQRRQAFEFSDILNKALGVGSI